MEICNVSRHLYICKNACMCCEFLLLHIFLLLAWSFIHIKLSENVPPWDDQNIQNRKKKSCLQFIKSPSSSRDDHKTAWTKKEKATIDPLLWSCRSTLKRTICVCSSCFPTSSSLWTRCFVPVASKFSCLITIHFSHLLPSRQNKCCLLLQQEISHSHEKLIDN